MTTEAVILAAGRGSRLGELAGGGPKCLVGLAGRPLIEWQIAALRAMGISRISIVTGYAADRLAYLKLPTIHNPRWADTNMVASLLCAKGALAPDGELIVSYGDIVYEPRIVRTLLKAPGDIATVIDLDWLKLWRIRSDDPLADAESLRLDAAGRVIDIGRRVDTLEEIEGQYIGLSKLSARGKRAVLDFAALADTDSWPLTAPLEQIYMTDLLRGLIARKVEVRAVPIRGGWLEVDTPRDLAAYEARLAQGTLDPLYAMPDAAAPW